jgi:hypothetical protein
MPLTRERPRAVGTARGARDGRLWTRQESPNTTAARRQPSPEPIAVYDGRALLGHVIEVAGHWQARDPAELLIGSYPTRHIATDALLSAPRDGTAVSAHATSRLFDADTLNGG